MKRTLRRTRYNVVGYENGKKDTTFECGCDAFFWLNEVMSAEEADAMIAKVGQW